MGIKWTINICETRYVLLHGMEYQFLHVYGGAKSRFCTYDLQPFEPENCNTYSAPHQAEHIRRCGSYKCVLFYLN